MTRQIAVGSIYPIEIILGEKFFEPMTLRETSEQIEPESEEFIFHNPIKKTNNN